MRVDLPAPLGPHRTRAGGGSPESPEAEPILARGDNLVWTIPAEKIGAFKGCWSVCSVPLKLSLASMRGPKATISTSAQSCLT